ncbi:ABC transporter substrate-binding protein [Rhodococcus sp. T7]|uniref:ABC transporter substrate-binding protein n=1 Tax=Rhodococcus sp. T7 TaxID=627444 RepID=UPI00135B7F7B|nr:ABC transporter substrate-binding protein [Rhodococcus sp. T7]KAF0960274.1 hypothetical protein MLGJGCBP_06666 [Rhodococcus sp. T7]
MFPRTWTVLVVAACVAALATSCGKDPVSDSPGISDTTIKIGALVDLGGPFAASGKAAVVGTNQAIADINARGGVCGRQMELVVKDFGYDTQRGVVAYDEIHNDVLALANIMSSPLTAALRDKINRDQMLAFPTGANSNLLGDPHLVVLGSTIDVSALNALDNLISTGVVKPGDTVGTVFLEGDWENSAMQGATWYADKVGITLADHHIKATDQDLSSQVTDLRNRGVKAVLVGASGQQVATIAALFESTGTNIPLVGVGPAWNTTMLDTAAAPALEQNFTRVWNSLTISDDAPIAHKLLDTWNSQYPGTRPQSGTGITAGYAIPIVLEQILEHTCGDLSRAGVLAARSRVETADTEGIYPPLDFSVPAHPSSVQANIQSVDPAAPDGLSSGPFFQSDLVLDYISDMTANN